MPLLASGDSSNEARTKLRRVRVMAAARGANPAAPEEGPNRSTAESTRQDRALGQMDYILQTSGGETVVLPACCAPLVG